MGFSRKLLAPGEDVVVESHPNWSILVPRAALASAVIAACVAVLVSWSAAPLWVGYVLLAAGLLALAGVLAKIITWRSTTLVITNARVIYRTGAIRRFGREIPLSRVQDVTYRQSVVERLLGAGTLTVESAGQSGQEPFRDVAHPAVIQSLINSLTFGSPGERGGSGRRPGPVNRIGGAAFGGASAADHLEAAQYGAPPVRHREAGGSGEPTVEINSTPAYGQPTPAGHDGEGGRAATGARPEESGDPADPWQPPPPTVLPPRWVGSARDRAPAKGPEEGPRSTSDQLARLTELHNLGVITDAELADKRRELLSGE